MEKIYQYDENGEPRLAAESQLSADILAMTEEEKAAAGWTLVPEAPRPPDTTATTHDMTITQTAEGPVMSWTPRQKTNEEITRGSVLAQIDSLNALLGTAGVADQTTLRGIKATANADINASPAKYLKALTDIVIALIKAERRTARMIARRFDSIE